MLIKKTQHVLLNQQNDDSIGKESSKTFWLKLLAFKWKRWQQTFILSFRRRGQKGPTSFFFRSKKYSRPPFLCFDS